jgi:heptosyltransferase-2
MDEKILVRGVNWIGDAVMTLPALKALKNAFPESKLSLLVKPSVAPVFEKNPFVDEVILYEKRFEGVLGKLKLAYRLRKAGFSKAVLFQNAFDAALIAYLAGIPERIGYERDGRGILLTKRIPFSNDDRKLHHTDYYLNLLRAAGIRAERSLPWVSLSPDERAAARDILDRMGRPVLGINPGAAYGSAKRWFPERFAEVARWFIRDTKGSVVIFGGGKELDITQEIEKLVLAGPGGREGSEQRSFDTRDHVTNTAGRTSLRELITLISECDVLLSNDSGPMHVAYAVGTPLVALFGSTDPGLTGPLGRGNVVLKSVLPCSPCFERTCRGNDMRCMYDIAQDDVFLAVKELLPDKKAVFFDRDGTLCEDMNYLNNRDNFRLLPGVEDLARLKAGGFMLIGVTNQSGVARGLVEEGFVEEINGVFINDFGFDGFFYCPHHPEEHCSCRKPEPGMLHDARRTYGIDLRKSYVVGDKEGDMLLAKAAGAKGVFIRTGRNEDSSRADFVAEGLREAVDFVLRDERT